MSDAGGDIELSVVVPVYNCASWVLPKLDEVVAHFSASCISWQLLVVDDGSLDGTADAVRAHFDRLPLAEVIRLPSNRGKGAAVLEGLRSGRGRLRIFMDCDLAYPLSEASKLVAALNDGADVAIANRRLPTSVCELRPELFKQVYTRHRFGVLFNLFVRLLGLTTRRDTQAGLKSLRADAIEVLAGMNSASRFAFDIEFLHLLERSHKKIVEVPVRYRYDDDHSSVQLVNAGWRMILEVLRIKLRSQGRARRMNGAAR